MSAKEENDNNQASDETIFINPPWLDLRLTEESMDHLWNCINSLTPQQQTDASANKDLAGNISRSVFLQDKDNWFYENVLKRCTETIYFKDWNNYYNVHIAKLHEAPEYVLDKLWVNYQKQNEFNPPHDHSGVFSFVVFMKIPTHWKEQHALPISVNSNSPSASNFEFLLGQGMGPVENIEFTLCPGDEGKILFFPAWLYHQVFPFYECEEDRITISGNIIPKTMVEYFDVRKRR